MVFPGFGGLKIVGMWVPLAFMADKIAGKADANVARPDGGARRPVLACRFDGQKLHLSET